MVKTLQKQEKLHFEDLIQKGENPLGFTSQTPNGTAHWEGTGWNKNFMADFDMPQVSPDATRPAGRSNRTGE
jgi:hypothetical protein